jgi:DNA-binding IclR family transcriptional regulator
MYDNQMRAGSIGDTTAAYADQPRMQPILEQQSRGFCARAEEITKLTSRLNEIANRTFGREPSEISGNTKAVPVPVPESTIGKLTDSGEYIDRAITSLGRAIGRFDSL